MLASRLLTILMLLQTRGRMSATALARELEVSVRSVHRDIDQLSAAGIPVYADRGRNGGFQLMDGYRTKLTGLTQSEAETLFLAGLPGPAAQLGLADILSAARLKLMAALPPSVQPGAERIASRFHLDPVGWFRGPDSLPSLQAVARAVWKGQRLKLGYRPAGQAQSRPRELSPLGLVLKGGIWYLVASSGKAIRTYRIANIQGVEETGESFERPKDFDLVAYWEKASREYETATYRGRARVRLSPKGWSRLELLGPFVVEEAARTAEKPDKHGWARCTLPVESGDYGLRELMRLGDEVEILEPPDLRARLYDLLTAMSRRHTRPATSRGAP